MTFYEYLNPKVLIADKGMKLRDRRDIYKESYINEDGDMVAEHIPNYFQILFINSEEIDSLEKCEEKYVEEPI